MNKRTINKLIGGVLLLGVMVFLLPHFVLAQGVGDLGLGQAQGSIGLGSGNLTLTIAKILRGFFGILGIVAVGFIIYGGFVWMTAGGSEEKVGEAKKIMLNGGIGLTIILSAFSIASFVIGAIVGGVNGVDGGGGNGSGDGNGGGGGFGYTDSMTVKMPGSTKAGFVTEFNLYFYKNFGSPAIPKLDTVIIGNTLNLRTKDGSAVNFDVIADANMLVLKSKDVCPTNKKQKPFCFPNDTEFLMEVVGGFSGINATDGTPLDCSTSSPCTATISTGNIDDVEAPKGIVESLQQVGGAGKKYWNGEGVPVESNYVAQGNASDDVEVKHIKLSKDGATYVVIQAPLTNGFYPSKLDISQSFDTKGLTPISSHSIGIEVSDTSENISTGTSFNYQAVGALCGNNKQDGDETGLDCGGTMCLKCTGTTCTNSTQCTSGICDSATNQCVQNPVIYAVTPGDGAQHNYITIIGKGFGATQGAGFVEFGTGTNALKAGIVKCGATPSWSDTQIIVQAPGFKGTASIKVQRADGKFDTTVEKPGPSLPDFIYNTTVRPGIACVTPGSGYFGSVLSVVGAGFGATQGTQSSISVGSVPVAPKQWGGSTISIAIPSISAGPQSVVVKKGTEKSNPFTIQVNEIQVGEQPVITSISPVTGGPGTVVTIQGSGFGAKKGSVFFGEKLGDMGFATQCGTNQWGNNKILVKVPSGATAGDVALIVERVEPTVKTKSTNFKITTDPPGPSICSINPNNGPQGIKVVISGNDLGEAGRVDFGDATKAVTFNKWNQTTIDQVVVPNWATSGDVFIQTKLGVNSNKYPFVVNDCTVNGCLASAETKCCMAGSAKGACVLPNTLCPDEAAGTHGSYEWIFSTGQIPEIPKLVYQCSLGATAGTPSPAPWNGRNGGNAVCVNAKVTGVISIAVAPMKLGSDIIFEKCTGSGDMPCATSESVDAEFLQEIEEGLGFEILPEGNLSPDTQYRVTLGTTIKSKAATGNGLYIPMLADSTCAKPTGLTGQPSACFTFTTQKGTEPCTVKSVLVEPNSFVSDTPINGQKILQHLPLTDTLKFVASGVGNDQCVLLNTSKSPWAWSVKDDPNPVSVSTWQEKDSLPDRTEAYGNKEHPPGKYAKINAEITNPDATKVSGFGNLNITLAKPKVIEFSPNCNKACMNGSVYLKFNTKMDTWTLYQDKVQMFECTEESCKQLGAKISFVTPNLSLLGNNNDAFTFSPAISLVKGKWYRVFVKGGESGVTSLSGGVLSGTNYGNDFSWKFRTRSEGDECVVKSVDVMPIEGTVKAIGQTIAYSAMPRGAPDECDAKGQLLSPWSYNWTWNTTSPLVATVSTANKGASFNWCTGQCTWAGSQPHPALCGDGAIHKPYEECDDGNLKDGDGCSIRCLREGVKSVAEGGTCGNGNKDTGEECDDKNNIDSDGCSKLCLNEGSANAGSVCGNGDVGAGEDCDDGNTVAGDGCSGMCVSEGSPRYNPKCSAFSANSSEALKQECAGEVYYSSCGNSKLEAGESCDDGNIKSLDGCSANCLLEKAPPVIGTHCGDGEVQANEGEQCDSAGEPDSNIDPIQSVIAVGQGSVVKDVQTTDVTSKVATGAAGKALFNLQCGYVSDAECASIGKLDTKIYGRATNSCCDIRPKVSESYPTDNSKNVCTNTSLWFKIDKELDFATLTSATVGLFKKVSEDTPTVCAPGSEPAIPFYVMEEIPHGFWKKIAYSVSHFVRKLVGGDEAQAQGYFCPTNIPGTVTARIENGVAVGDGAVPASTIITFMESQLLPANTTLYFGIKGGPNGAKGKNGVAMNGKDGGLHWHSIKFTTGAGLCALDHIEVAPKQVLLTKPSEQVSLNAKSITKGSGNNSGDGGASGTAEIIPINGVYDWKWSWSESTQKPEGTVVYPTTTTSTAGVATPSSKSNTQIVKVNGKQGSVMVTGIAQIDSDGGMGSKGMKFDDSSEVNVFLCENPWPAISNNGGTFADSATAVYNSDFSANLLAGGAGSPLYTNFSTRFCRDQGVANDKTDDLPSLQPIVIGIPPQAQTLKEFFFSPSTDEKVKINKDIIGIRVEKNPDHLPLGAWYKSRGFSGSPQLMTVAGFPALVDGRTVYISALNAEINNELVSGLRTNVYVLSYNQFAEPTTLAIFNQLLNNIKLMINTSPSGLCFADKDTVGQKTTGESLITPAKKCSSDIDCNGETVATGFKSLCDTVAEKAARDLNRVSDFGTIESLLSKYYSAHNSYPVIASGSFLPGTSVSTWKSWQSELGNALGIAVPTDPLNKLGECTNGAKADVDSATCWNAVAGTYSCPLNSMMYEYDALQGGQSYVLKSEFELPAALWKDNQLGSPYWQTSGSCSGTSVSASTKPVCGNKVIETGEECDPKDSIISEEIYSSVDKQYLMVSYTCTADCKKGSVALSAKSACGNGTLDSGETCDDGKKNGMYGYCQTDCKAKMVCGDGVLQTANTTSKGPEVCETARCSNSKNFLCNPKNSNACLFDSLLGCASGNGCTATDFPGCTATTVTPPGGGAKVTKYDCGNCEIKGTVYAADKLKSCNWDCRSFGPYCGDGVVSNGEACDVGPNGGAYKEQCTQTGANNGQPGEKNGECNKDCTWKTEPITCEPIQTKEGAGTQVVAEGCGDLKKDVSKGEECDLGSYNGIPCYAAYGQSCNYCSKPSPSDYVIGCTLVPKSGGFCGDGTLNGPEQCDTSQFKLVKADICKSYGYDYGTPTCNAQCTGTTEDGCNYCGVAQQKPSEQLDVGGVVVDPTIQQSGTELLANVAVLGRYNGKTVKGEFLGGTTGKVGEYGLMLNKAQENGNYQCTLYSLKFSNNLVKYYDDESEVFAAGTTSMIRGYLFPTSKLGTGKFGIVVEWDGTVNDIDTELQLSYFTNQTGTLNKNFGNSIGTDTGNGTFNKLCGTDVVSCLDVDDVHAELNRKYSSGLGYETMTMSTGENGFTVGGKQTYYRLKVIDNSGKLGHYFNDGKAKINVKTYSMDGGNMKVSIYPFSQIETKCKSSNSCVTNGKEYWVNFVASDDGKTLNFVSTELH